VAPHRLDVIPWTLLRGVPGGASTKGRNSTGGRGGASRPGRNSTDGHVVVPPVRV